MATIIYVEHKSGSGIVYRREPSGSYREAIETLRQILDDIVLDGELADGDTFCIIQASDANSDR